MTPLIDAAIAELALNQFDYDVYKDALDCDLLRPEARVRFTVRIGLIERNIDFLTKYIIHMLCQQPLIITNYTPAPKQNEY